MLEITLIFTAILGALTIGSAVEYFALLRRVRTEYQRASEVVGDIVVSVKKEFENQDARLEALSYKLQGLSSRGNGSSTRTTEMEKKLSALKGEVDIVRTELDSLLTKLDGIHNRVFSASTSHQLLNDRVTRLEEQTQEALQAEPKIGAVIPIKREKAIAPLTETELSFLDVLVKEGRQTAPEIKARLGLSREHTARLMKKLYEAGYLERETKKIPFEYYIKDEMRSLLVKAQSEV